MVYLEIAEVYPVCAQLRHLPVSMGFYYDESVARFRVPAHYLKARRERFPGERQGHT
ncbi:MAG: hypothetical protein GX117_10415 [Candidatus Hydrogenedentes bacterium]|nr:hypothetical protein [Candidatus Hydrogenedentota bacterium]